MDCVEADDTGRDIPIVVCMRFAPCLCAAKPGFLGTGENHADFGVFQTYAEPLHFTQNGDSHVAAGQVVVGSVDHLLWVVGTADKQEKRNKQQPPKSGRVCPDPCTAERADSQCHIEQDTDHRDNTGNLEYDTAKVIIERKFPCCIDVPVQEDPSFNQACTGAKSGHVGACPLREEGINQLFV